MELWRKTLHFTIAWRTLFSHSCPALQKLGNREPRTDRVMSRKRAGLSHRETDPPGQDGKSSECSPEFSHTAPAQPSSAVWGHEIFPNRTHVPKDAGTFGKRKCSSHRDSPPSQSVPLCGHLCPRWPGGSLLSWVVSLDTLQASKTWDTPMGTDTALTGLP